MNYGLEFTDTEFKLLKTFIYQQTGICLAEYKKPFLVSRLRKRLTSLRLNSFKEYYNYLTKHPAGQKEMMHMISLITTGKTQFFREKEHFEYLTNKVFPYFLKKAMAKQKIPKLYIWSAGCSTGEEAYSLAMVANDYFSIYPQWEIEILATDIDMKALNKAKSGIYTSKEIASLPSSYGKRYFQKVKGQDLFKIKDVLKDLIVFKYFNLSTDYFIFEKKFDIIFCRNVIIYLDLEVKERVIQGFYKTLSEDGFLFLGQAESLLAFNNTPFLLFAPSIYRKKPLET